MKAKRCVQAGALLAVLLVYAQSATAALWEDPAAFMSDRVPFGALPAMSGGVLSGFVDYAVYMPHTYSGSPMFNDLWVYAYQVSNSIDSTVGIDYFSVGLSPDVYVRDVAYDPAMGFALPNGRIPSMHFKLPESVIYLYLTDNIGADECSLTLLFTSNNGPEMSYGYVSGGVAGGENVPLPSPTPEPASFSLLVAGALLAFRRRSKS